MSTDYKTIIAKKSAGDVLTKEEVEGMVKAISQRNLADRIKDLISNGKEVPVNRLKDLVDQCENNITLSQIGAFVMAIYLKKLTPEETSALTMAMKNSGDQLDYPAEWKEKRIILDKHSTGGVGDKVSLVLAPALAALGYKVPMISGRSLEHTGGTLDKLESIPGYRVDLNKEEMIQTLTDVGCFITGQTGNVCPADKAIYAIRDDTSTVNELGLITSSIISKKAAENLSGLVLDVKIGDGAFMKTVDQGRTLAQSMVDCSQSLGTDTVSLLTDMNSPIGNMSGNALEVLESVRTLQNEGPQDLVNLVVNLGGYLLKASKHVKTPEEGFVQLREAISSGKALEKFKLMLQAQGVKKEDAETLCTPGADVWSVMRKAARQVELKSPSQGFVKTIGAMTVAKALQGLVRNTPGQTFNHAAGVELLVDVGDAVENGQTWAKIHCDADLPPPLRASLEQALQISVDPVQPRESRVLEVILPTQHSSN